MSESTEWAFPQQLQPKDSELRYDLDAALDALVMVRTEIPSDGFTASILGTERAGNGVVIADDGLVLTIGYLITEATTVWLTTNRGRAVAGHPLAYDQATGFGLVQALGKLGVPALPRGSAASCAVGDAVVMAGHGGRAHALSARINDKREFAGYWEYVLDEAIFTVPAHPQWGGAALINAQGRLLGIGSLLVQETTGQRKIEGNMIVPIDLLEPILDDMMRQGRPSQPPRPWLGMYTTEVQGETVIAGLAPRGPAEKAKLRTGDVVTAVAGAPVAGLADLFRKIWRLGPAGVDVPLTVMRKGQVRDVQLRSADRGDFLKKPHLH